MAAIKWEFLAVWSAERAWWWGAFLGDGSAPSEGRSLHITGVLSTVLRWRDLVAPTTNLPPYEPPYELPNSPGTFRGLVCSTALSDWVHEHYGIRGPKSATLPWPEHLPHALKPHFLRGLWDTDGHLSLIDRKKNGHRGNLQPTARFRSEAKGFVARVRDELAGLLPGLHRASVSPSTYTREDGTEGTTWQVVYDGASAMRVADLLYANAPEHIRNEERWEAYKALCGQRDRMAAPCACGEPKHSEDLCRSCHRTALGRRTGPGTSCSTEGCGKPVLARGVCAACRSRARRSAPGYTREAQGACPCGATAYRKGLCDACYERRRRGVPTRFEPPVPRPPRTPDPSAAPCPCGSPARRDGQCYPCWYAERRPRAACSTEGCGKPVKGRGLCVACYTRARRAAPGYVRPSTGACACGSPAYRLGLCDACYHRRRRGRPTRSETGAAVPVPLSG